MQTEDPSPTHFQKFQFDITINASKEKVWQILWDAETYNSWTSAFSEGSIVESDWNEGSPIHFLDGKGSGMYSLIEKKIPNEFISFKHIGEIKDGKEQPLDEKSRSWSGCLENYTLQEKDGKTTLNIGHEAPKEFLDFFNETFPKAMQKIIELAETKE